MTERIMAVDSDRIDIICWRHYGSLDYRVVEQVLDANPGLSMSAELVAGQIVLLPEIDTTLTLERSLW